MTPKKIIVLYILLFIAIPLFQTAPSYAQTLLDKNGTLPDYKQVLSKRDVTALSFDALDVMKHQQEVLHAKISKDRLLQEIEDAVQKNNAQTFVEKTNLLNAMLLEYIKSSNLEVRAEGAAALLEQLHQGVITAEDAQKAFDIFEKNLRQNKTCSGSLCSFLNLSALGLAFRSKEYAEANDKKQFSLQTETGFISPPRQKQKEYLALIKELSLNNYGSAEANALMAKSFLIAAAALGSPADLTEITQNIVTAGGNLIRKKLNANVMDNKNAQAQIAAMDTLFELGKEAKPVLKDFAFNRRTLTSFVYANINMAYTALTKEEEKLNKQNLENLYCYQVFNISSQDDFELKQKIAYAYGRGYAQAYVTSSKENKCLVTVPVRPDPRLVAQENTNFVMKELGFAIATSAIGPILSTLKNGVKIIKHFKALKYLAGKRNMTLGQFFMNGQLKNLPRFAAPLERKTVQKVSLAAAQSADLARQAQAPARATQTAQTAAKTDAAANAAVKDAYKGPVFQKAVTGEPVPKPLKLRRTPKKNPFTGEYPSGLKNDEQLAQSWIDYYKNGYFSPRDQIEAIEGMSAAKANNTMEYLYYMSMDDAKATILDPLDLNGRLPNFMYDGRLIPNTKRLPSGYYKNKFNDNLEKLLAISEGDGTLYSHNAELKDILISMRDYTFDQGFSYQNNYAMAKALRDNFGKLVKEIETKGFHASRSRFNKLWNMKVKGYKNDKQVYVSLKDFFNQTRKSPFLNLDKAVPEFYLNSPKWVSWENERRNLAALTYTKDFRPVTTLSQKIKNTIRPAKSKYITVEAHGKVLTDVHSTVPDFDDAMTAARSLADSKPSTLTTKINNFEVLGGACQSGFGENMCLPGQGYDGTKIINRFFYKTEKNVKVIVFDAQYKPVVVELEKVSYVIDQTNKDIDLLRASTMSSHAIDDTRDILTVAQAEKTLQKLPHLKATIYPHSRFPGIKLPEDLKGGGLNAHLALFTKDFFPIKTTVSLEFSGLKPTLVRNYWVPKEISALAGNIHGPRLPFLSQVQDKVVKVLSAPIK